MIYRRLAILAVVVCVSCKPQAPKPSKPAAVPQVRATVVTIRTTVAPEKRTLISTIVIANDKARDTSEQDVWHLYDLKAGSVTVVDDLAKTFRTERLPVLVQRKRAALATALPAHYPRLSLRRTNEQRAMQGATAHRHVIEHGGYQRELWIAEHPAIPRDLFAMMQASERPTTPLAPMMRAADEALMAMRGFPLLDHTKAGPVVVERAVVSIGQRNVPAALLEVPRAYQDLTPKEGGSVQGAARSR